jgi:KDO2-lipid IV(A) lauroyltransferase
MTFTAPPVAADAPRPAPSFRHRVEYRAALAVRALTRILPDTLSRGFGAALGMVFLAADVRHRRVAQAQLRAAFPRKSDAECRAITRAAFRHFGRLLTSVLRFSTLSRDEMRARVEYEGEERVRAAEAAGKGVIFFTGHFGFWEVQALAHALVFPPTSLLARPLDNPLLHDLLERIRTSTGNRLIYKQGAVRQVLAALKQNEAIAVLIDQHTHSADGVMIDFFNRPAAATSTVATLALRTGAALVPVFALPLANGRFRMIYEPPVEMPAETSEDPVRELTQRCTDVLEMYVRRHPHLWLWMHRRWRTEDPA